MTLDEAWEKTMRMWRWIVDQPADRDVCQLKVWWIKENDPGFDGDDCCYFCKYAQDQCEGEYASAGSPTICKFCPGRLISPKFDCQAQAYHYYYKPKKFLAKLEELNAKRRK